MNFDEIIDLTPEVSLERYENSNTGRFLQLSIAREPSNENQICLVKQWII